MDNTAFVNEENIPVIDQDEDYDDTTYETPNTSRIEISFTVPDTTEPTSTLRVRAQLKRDKLIALYSHLNVTGNLDFIDLDRFKLIKDSKKRVIIFEFYNGNDRWVPLTKQTGQFFAPKTLKDRFGGLNIMKNVLGLDETPPSFDRSIKAATKLKGELPAALMMESITLKHHSSLVEDIHVKTRKASQNNDLDMREFLAIDKALQSIQGELLNNTAKLKEINARIERDTKKLKEVENDPTYNDEQRQLYKDRLDDLNTEKQARLEILSQNRKDLGTQVARIKQTLEKVLDKDASLLEKILILFREQGITIASILSALSMTITTIALAITGVFGRTGGTGGSPSKGRGTLKKWLNRLADALKRLVGKAAEALPAIVESIVGAILSFFGKPIGFVAEHTWNLIVFVAGLVGWWLMQKIKKD